MKTLLLIIWMIITLLLTISLVGMLLFIGWTAYHTADDIYERDKSTWMKIGIKLLDSIIENHYNENIDEKR